MKINRILLIAAIVVVPLAARPRRIVIIVRPAPRIQAASVGGYIAGRLIQQWIEHRQGRAPGACDALVDAGCNVPAPQPVPVTPCTGTGCSYLPGQTPGFGDGK